MATRVTMDVTANFLAQVEGWVHRRILKEITEQMMRMMMEQVDQRDACPTNGMRHPSTPISACLK